MPYDAQMALAARLLAEKGFAATIRAQAVASDPVTGAGGSDGASRTINAVKTQVDRRRLPESLAERAECILICAGAVAVGEVWVDGAVDRPVIGVMPVEPDNTSRIITKAIIGA